MLPYYRCYTRVDGNFNCVAEGYFRNVSADMLLLVFKCLYVKVTYSIVHYFKAYLLNTTCLVYQGLHR